MISVISRKVVVVGAPETTQAWLRSFLLCCSPISESSKLVGIVFDDLLLSWCQHCVCHFCRVLLDKILVEIC